MPVNRPLAPDEPQQLLVSRKKAARMLDVHPDTLDKLLNEPSCPLEARWLGGKRMIPVDQLREFALSLPTERAS